VGLLGKEGNETEEPGRKVIDDEKLVRKNFYFLKIYCQRKLDHLFSKIKQLILDGQGIMKLFFFSKAAMKEELRKFLEDMTGYLGSDLKTADEHTRNEVPNDVFERVEEVDTLMSGSMAAKRVGRLSTKDLIALEGNQNYF